MRSTVGGRFGQLVNSQESCLAEGSSLQRGFRKKNIQNKDVLMLKTKHVPGKGGFLTRLKIHRMHELLIGETESAY